LQVLEEESLEDQSDDGDKDANDDDDWTDICQYLSQKSEQIEDSPLPVKKVELEAAPDSPDLFDDIDDDDIEDNNFEDSKNRQSLKRKSSFTIDVNEISKRSKTEKNISSSTSSLPSLSPSPTKSANSSPTMSKPSPKNQSSVSKASKRLFSSSPLKTPSSPFMEQSSPIKGLSSPYPGPSSSWQNRPPSSASKRPSSPMERQFSSPFKGLYSPKKKLSSPSKRPSQSLSKSPSLPQKSPYSPLKRPTEKTSSPVRRSLSYPMMPSTSSSVMTPMPEYESMLSPALRQELRRFGLKVIPRQKAVPLLRHIYDETHPGVVRRKVNFEDETDDKDLNLSQESIGDDDLPEESLLFEDQQGQQDDAEAEAGDLDDGSSLTDKLLRFIQDDPELHRQVLMYEPLWLEDFFAKFKDIMTLTKTKVKLAHVQDILDNECITFRTRARQVRNVKRNGPKK
jgi:hypothetical protein